MTAVLIGFAIIASAIMLELCKASSRDRDDKEQEEVLNRK